MFSSRSGINLSIIFSSLFNFISSKPQRRRSNTHDYTQSVKGRDYVFEFVEGQIKAQMTAQGKGIKRGDYIILQNQAYSEQYQVEEIEYYSDPADMWMALLRKS